MAITDKGDLILSNNTHTDKGDLVLSVGTHTDKGDLVLGLAAEPTVSTSAASSVGITTATLNGNLTSLGDFETVNVWFEYRIVGAGSWTTTAEQEKTVTGAFSQALSGLDDDEDYEFRAVVEWDDGETQTDTGDTLEFSTEAYEDPAATTSAATSVTGTSATLNGSVDIGNYIASADAYFQWGIAGDALTETTEAQTLTGDDTVDAAISGLEPGVTYAFRLVVEWESGESTVFDAGSILSFTATPPSAGTITIGSMGVGLRHSDGYPYLYPESLLIQLRIDHRDAAELTVVTKASLWKPQVGESLVILDDEDAVIFGGTVNEVSMSKGGAAGVGGDIPILVEVTSNGYWHIPARRTVTCEYGSQTCGYIVADLRTTHLADEGVTAGTISAGMTLDSYVKPASSIKDILDELAELSGYKWYIDNDKALHFVADDAIGTAAHSLIEGGEFKDYRNVRVTQSLEMYRNKQFVVGGMVSEGESEETLVYSEELSEEIADRQAIEGGEGESSGVYGDVYRNAKILTTADAEDAAENLLKLYGTIPTTVSFDSVETLDWRPGEQLEVALPTFGLGIGLPPEDDRPAVPAGFTEVGTAEAFNNIRNNLSGNYALTADIDLSGYENWVPIGSAAAPFTGQLEGRYYKITGLVINRPDNQCVGLFGSYAYGGGDITSYSPFTQPAIRRVILEEVDITGQEFVGGIVGGVPSGNAVNHCIDLCSVTGSITGETYVGGIMGGAFTALGSTGNECNWISRCFVDGDVYGDEYVGGIIGYTSRVHTVYACYAKGSVKSGTDNHIGGIQGWVQGAYISGGAYNVICCYAAVEMTPDDTHPHTSTKPKDGIASNDCGSSPSIFALRNYFDYELTLFSAPYNKLTSPGGAPAPTYNMTAPGYVEWYEYPGGSSPYLWKTYRTDYAANNWPWGSVWAIAEDINEAYPYLVDLPPEEELPWDVALVIESVDIRDVGASSGWQATVTAVTRLTDGASSQKRDGWVDWFSKLARKANE